MLSSEEYEILERLRAHYIYNGFSEHSNAIVLLDEFLSLASDHDEPWENPATWVCKVGEIDRKALEHWGGADLPMRDQVAAAYELVTGHEPDFIFSGWGGRLTRSERAVVNDE